VITGALNLRSAAPLWRDEYAQWAPRVSSFDGAYPSSAPAVRARLSFSERVSAMSRRQPDARHAPPRCHIDYTAFDPEALISLRGDWEVRQLRANTQASLFWRCTIEAYTHGRFKETWMDDEHWRGRVQPFHNG
jgi:hypothetical protein